MVRENSLKRFVSAQIPDYETALAEVKNGRKKTHWMWYIFPQIQGLGFSEISKYYAIQNLDEAEEFLDHPVLGSRLLEISKALLALECDNAAKIFGNPDNLKLKSCMTLFSSLKETSPVFQHVLEKFFKGSRDNQTLRLIKMQL